VRAQTARPTGQPGQLGPVIVTEPKRKPVKRTSSATRRAPASKRVANRDSGRPAAPTPAATDAAVWGDPSYPDQILLGAPRTYELAAAFKW
jgi:hypothetical protein